MTWQHLLRTMMIAGVAIAAPAFASQVRAESGDGSNVYAILGEATETPAPEGAAAGAEQASLGMAAEEAPKSKDEGAPKRASGTLAAGGQASSLKPLIARYASESGLPYELADAVIRLESRYNAAARNGPLVGLTQIDVRTAQALGYQGPAAGLLDAETNLRYGLKYLAQAYELAGGDTCGTILRYRAGHRAQAMTKSASLYCSKVKTILAKAE
jgi:soluble lytic murein transglycosylase-like protein